MMNDDEIGKLIQEAASDLHRAWHRLTHEGRTPTAIHAILANAAGWIPDHVWAAMMEHAGKPCGRPGCQCHVRTARLFEALDGLRTDHQTYKDFAGALRRKRN